MNEIKIKNSKIIKDDKGSVRLSYSICVDKLDYSLWYEVDEKWGEYLCDSVADPVVIAILSYAIRGGYDIVSELPVSRRLLFNLRSQVIPQLHLCTTKSFDIDIHAPISSESFDPKAAVTALSMGVDSFTTFFEYTRDCPPEADPITHLVFFENGDHRWGIGGESDVFAQQKNAVQKFCDTYGWELVVIRSNIDIFLRDAFWAEGLVETSTYKHVSTALSLQKFIKTYYYSASYNLDGFHCDLNEDVTDYEKWLLPLISTETTCFASSNKAMSRVEKTKYISQFPETYDNLLVCCFDGVNCGKCNKCIRTELTLHKLGCLEKYSKSFDLDFFYSHINEAEKTAAYWKSRSAIDMELFDLIKDDMRLNNKMIGTIHGFIGKKEKLSKMYFKVKKQPVGSFFGRIEQKNLLGKIDHEENK